MIHISCLYYCTECKYTTEIPITVQCIEYDGVLTYCEHCEKYQTIKNLGEDLNNKQEALERNAILYKEVMVHLNNTDRFLKKF